MTQYDQLRDSARRLNGLARATSDKELRGRYLEEALSLAQNAEELDRGSIGRRRPREAPEKKAPPG